MNGTFGTVRHGTVVYPTYVCHTGRTFMAATSSALQDKVRLHNELFHDPDDPPAATCRPMADLAPVQRPYAAPTVAAWSPSSSY
jgi:hypothetical protein